MSEEANEVVALSPRAVKRRDKNISRFLSKVKKPDEGDGCWEWLAGHGKDGYGSFWLNGETMPAHRASYIIHIGAIPSGLCVCHSCDNVNCVRSEHLFLGTHAQNVADRQAKGRQSRGEKHGAIMRARDLRGDKNPMRLHPESVLRGEKSPTSKLTEAQVIEIRQRYAAGDTTQKKLGAEYGVNFSLIGYIVNRKIWKHIP